MIIEEALSSLEAKFSSGNSIAVTRAVVTLEEYQTILEYIDHLVATLEEIGDGESDFGLDDD